MLPVEKENFQIGTPKHGPLDKPMRNELFEIPVG